MVDDAPTPPATLRIGALLDDRYRLDAVLGEGGIGQVFEATHLALGTSVAVKVLRPEYAATESLRKRFQREAKALTELSHPNIVTVTDLGVSDGVPYLVMEKVEGEPLSSRLREGPVDPHRALALTRQLLRAVNHAHERGLVHRDLKPGNILLRELDDGDHLTVLDFGLARYTGERGRRGTKLTRRGMLIGTPAYMAPEQAAGGQVDERVDVYAIGLIAYELLTGRRPFLEKATTELLRAHLIEPAPPLETARPGLQVDDALERWVQRALAKERGDRFPNAKAMLDALDAIGDDAIQRASAPGEEPPSNPDAVAETLPGVEPAPRTPATLPGRRASSPRPAPAVTRGRAPKRPRAAVWFAIAALVATGGLLALAAGGVIFAFVLSSDDAGVEAEPTVSSPRAPVTPTSTPETSAQPPAAAQDPFGALPAALATPHARVRIGARLRTADVGALNRYNREHPDDPRGHLILGRHYTALRSLSWAYPEYATALELDPASRHWPAVLPDLLEMVRSERLHRASIALIAGAWGRDALPAARAERARVRRRYEQRRLDALIERLEAL